jgi:hypothetical protein
MPFSFTQTEVDDISTASKWDVPFNTWLGVKFGQGFHDTLGSVISRNVEESIWDNGDLMSPELANKSFGIPGHLEWKEPVSIQKARLFRERKEKELEGQMYAESASHEWYHLKGIGGFVAGIAGSISHPLDLGAGYLIGPVGSSAKAAELAKAGASAWRQGVARGLVTRETLQAYKFPKFTEAVIDGTFGNAVFEIPVYLQNVKEQADYTLTDSIVNVVAGGVFAGGLHVGLRGLERIRSGLSGAQKLMDVLDKDTKAAAFRQAVNQMVSDDMVDVSAVIKMDRNFISKQVVAELRESLPAKMVDEQVYDLVDRVASLSDTIDALRQSGEEGSDKLIQALSARLDSMRELEGQQSRSFIDSIQEEIPLREQVTALREQAKTLEGDARIATLAKAVDAERAADTLKSIRESDYFNSPKIQKLIDEKQQKAFRDFLTHNKQKLDEKLRIENDRVGQVKKESSKDVPPLKEEEVEAFVAKERPEAEDASAIEADANRIASDMKNEQLTPEDQQAMQEELDAIFNAIDGNESSSARSSPEPEDGKFRQVKQETLDKLFGKFDRELKPRALLAALESGELKAGETSTALLKHLIKSVDSEKHPVRISLVDDFKSSEEAGFQGKFKTYYHSTVGDVLIVPFNTKGELVKEHSFVRILNHELLHNAVTSKLKTAPMDIFNRVNNLFKFAKREAGGTKWESHNALKNKDEFIAEALSRSDFRKWLASKEYRETSDVIEGRGKLSTLMGGVLDIVRRLLGLRETITHPHGHEVDSITALDEVISVSEKLMSEKREAMIYAEYGTPFDGGKAVDAAIPCAIKAANG